MAGSMTFATGTENEAFDKCYNDGFEEGKKDTLEKQAPCNPVPEPSRHQALYMAIDFARSQPEGAWDASKVCEAAKTFEEYLNGDNK